MEANGLAKATNRTFSFLNYTLPDYLLIDVVRLAFVVLAFLVALLAFRVAKSRKFLVYWGGAIACTGLGLLELQQIGKKFVPWRLPVFLLAVVLIGLGVRRVFREW